MKNKYILFSDAKSPHTLKWLKELVKYFDIYLVSLNGYSKEVLDYINKDRLFVLNDSVNQGGGNIKLISKYFALEKLVKQINPEYINAHYLSSYGVIAALIKKKYPNIKLIQSTWGTDILVTPFESFVKKAIAKFALNSADLITSDSFYMSDKIEEISGKKCNIDTFAFGLEDMEFDNHIEKDDKLIFSNRALSENYNIDKIVKWFAKFNNRDLKLIIANDGDKKEYLKELVDSLNISDRVEFVGFLNKEEQENFYKKSQYYISVPTSDSTAVSLLEAMAFGCYPILSNIPANREWILDGCNGSFFNGNMALPSVDIDIININQDIIKKRAIFSKNIQEFVKKVESL